MKRTEKIQRKNPIGVISTVVLLILSISVLLFSLPLTSPPVVAASATTTTNISPVADAKVANNPSFVNTNYGTSHTLRIETYDWSGEHRDWRTYLRFDLRGLPSGATILGATLFLYCIEGDACVHRSQSIIVHRCHDNWGETGITWNNQPMGTHANPVENFLTTSNFPVPENAGPVNAWFSWDVTEAVQQEWAGDRIISFMLRDAHETAWVFGIWTRYVSRENSNTSLRPYLRIQHNSPSPGEVVPDPGFDGGWGTWGATGGTWANHRLEGVWTTWTMDTPVNVRGNLTDQETHIVYNRSREADNAPTPIQIDPGVGVVQWHWHTHGSWVIDEAYSDIWDNLNFSGSTRIYDARLSFSWRAQAYDWD